MASHATGDPGTYAVIGAAMKIHRELGCGFLEAVYREALRIEFACEGIPYRSKVGLPLSCRGHALKTNYRPDFICHGRIIVEVKAIRRITAIESAQVINYLKASRLSVGLMLNFADTSLDYRRFVLQPGRSAQ